MLLWALWELSEVSFFSCMLAIWFNLLLWRSRTEHIHSFHFKTLTLPIYGHNSSVPWVATNINCKRNALAFFQPNVCSPHLKHRCGFSRWEFQHVSLKWVKNQNLVYSKLAFDAGPTAGVFSVSKRLCVVEQFHNLLTRRYLAFKV